MAKNETAKAATPKGAIDLARKSGAKMVDIKFVDTFGTWQHFSVPVSELTEEVFEEGFGFDGSSIRGWKSIEASDMLAMPDPATAFIDPFCAVPTLSLTCTIAETGTKEPYNRDPRGIAQRGEKYLQSTGIADTAVFGPEAEFFIFDNVQYDYQSNGSFHSVDSQEAAWNTGRDEMPNLGYKIRHKEGYLPVAPTDTQQDIRTEMCLLMEQLGIQVERQHHEVATAGQAEIDFRFGTLVKTADTMMLYKYIIKNVARRHGKTVTFMPKPLYGDNGSGMHTHQSLWKKGKPLFYNITQGEIELFPTPDATHNLEMYYYGKIPALSASNATNAVLTFFPDAYLYGSLVHTAPYLGDDQRTQVWAALYQSTIDAINRQSESAKQGAVGRKITIRSY